MMRRSASKFLSEAYLGDNKVFEEIEAGLG